MKRDRIWCAQGPVLTAAVVILEQDVRYKARHDGIGETPRVVSPSICTCMFYFTVHS